MKKQVLTIALALGVAGAFAQELTSKKGEKILPEAGDWAIGFDAIPMVNSIGVLMGGSGNVANGGTTVTSGGVTNTFMGKMFKDDKTAYRAMLGLNFGSTTTKNAVYDDQAGVATPDPNKTVIDQRSVSARSITLGGGLEMRRGNTRLQGYYGGMVAITLGGGSTTNTYGNIIASNNTSATTTTNFDTKTSAKVGGRVKSTSGSTFGLGINGFLGAEYFIAPKVSIGAEYQWGLNFTSTGDTKTDSESWDPTAGGSLKSTSVTTPGGSSFGLGNGIGSLMIMLHF